MTSSRPPRTASRRSEWAAVPVEMGLTNCSEGVRTGKLRYVSTAGTKTSRPRVRDQPRTQRKGTRGSEAMSPQSGSASSVAEHAGQRSGPIAASPRPAGVSHTSSSSVHEQLE